MINKIWCDPRNISIACLIWNISPLSAAHSICPGSFHQSSLLPFTFHHRQTLAWLCPNSTMSSAATSINTLMLPLSSRGTLTKPTSRRSCRTFTNMYPVQLEDRIHCIIATLSLRMPTKQATETVTIRTIRIDRKIRDAVNHRTATYNAGLLPGNMSEYKASCYALRRTVRAAKL